MTYDKKAIDKNKWMIDPDDAVMLLIDHQSGLFQLLTERSVPPWSRCTGL